MVVLTRCIDDVFVDTAARACKELGCQVTPGSETPSDPGTPEPSTTNNCWPSRAPSWTSPHKRDVKKTVALLKIVLQSIPTVMSSIRACQHPEETQREAQTSKTSWEQATEADDERGHNLCGQEEGMNRQEEEPQAPVVVTMTGASTSNRRTGRPCRIRVQLREEFFFFKISP